MRGVGNPAEEEKGALLAIHESSMVRYGVSMKKMAGKELEEYDFDMGHFAGRAGMSPLPEGAGIKAYMDGFNKGRKEAEKARRKYDEYAKKRAEWEASRPRI